MATAPVTPSPDQGPPLPPNLQPAPQATLQGMAGQSPTPGPASGTGSAALAAQVVQKAMFIEASLNDIATMMPSAAPAIAGMIDLLRKGIGQALAQGATPPPAPGPPSGMMMLGQGGAGAAPVG